MLAVSNPTDDSGPEDLNELERLMAAEFRWGFLPYPYAQLPTSTSIRVLEILPENQNRHGHTSCALRTVDLKDNPSYTALSYT
jgi:hypothetical protein